MDLDSGHANYAYKKLWFSPRVSKSNGPMSASVGLCVTPEMQKDKTILPANFQVNIFSYLGN